MRAFGWSLDEIDRTNVESLLPFLRRYSAQPEPGKPPARRVYADQVNWL